MKKWILLITALLLVVVVVGCGKPGVGSTSTADGKSELDFDTIDIGQSPPQGMPETDYMEGPKLVVIDNVKEASGEATQWISQEARQQVLETNFRAYFVVVAFQGRKGASERALEVKRLSQTGDRVEVAAIFYEWRGPGLLLVSSPYHVIMVPKVGRMALQPLYGAKVEGAYLTPLPLTFVLVDQAGNRRAETRHLIDRIPEFIEP